MPQPVDRSRPYRPGLDGLRAIAVLSVLAYHLTEPWAPGGLLGVALFFTLSGYLITDMLLEKYRTTGRLGLTSFWLQRARRLLPALGAMLVVVLAWVTLLHRDQLAQVRRAVLAAMLYVSNWWQIGEHQSYFARFGTPPPLEHLWSLAVEEQFYLIWPFVLLVAVTLSGRARARDRALGDDRPSGLTGAERSTLTWITLALAGGSAVLMALLFRPGGEATRIYEGTDTRAFGLLIGAAAAVLLPSSLLARPLSVGVRVLLDLLGVGAVVGILAMIHNTNPRTGQLYQGGLVVFSLLTAVAVVAVFQAGSVLGRVLGVQPLRWIGVRSYGIYLWHYPIIALTTPLIGAVSGVRIALQVGATFVISALSWRYLEDPIRRNGFGLLFGKGRVERSPFHVLPAPAARVVALVGVLAVTLTACVGAVITPPATPTAAPTRIAVSEPPAPSVSPVAGSHAPSATAANAAGSTAHATPTTSGRPLAAPTRTSCSSVVHIGDSTSEGLVSPDYLPDPAQRIDARYRAVGVRSVTLEIDGGTSILETIDPSQPNAFEVAQRIVQSGYHGCWVLALGTNDTADVYVGSVEDQAQRITKMMNLLKPQNVMWVDVKSLLTRGPYSNADMTQWNDALRAACARYPDMRVYDWASVVQNAWFGSDGIHYTTPGYAARARLIAGALVKAFPQGRPPVSGCFFH